jgi:hypothetical protein
MGRSLAEYAKKRYEEEQKKKAASNTSVSNTKTTSAGNTSYTKPSGSSSNKPRSLEEYAKKRYEKEQQSLTPTQKWEQQSNHVLSDIQSYYSDWRQDRGEKKKYYNEQIDSLIKSADQWRIEHDGNEDALKAIDSIVKGLSSGKKLVEDSDKYYSQWDSEGAYKAYIKDKNKLDELNSMSVKDLEPKLKDKSKIAYTTSDGQKITWQQLYDKKKKQEDADSLYNNLSSQPDFQKYVQQGASIKNPTVREAENGIKFFGLDTRPDIGNPVTYSRENWDEIEQESFESGATLRGDIRHTFMDDKQVEIYNYYLAKFGKDRADEYFKSIEDDLTDAKWAKDVENSAKFAKDAPVLASVGSVATSLGSSLEYVYNTGKYALTGEMGKSHMAEITNAVRGSVQEEVDLKIGNWDAFDFVYSTAMSGADSLVAGAVPGGEIILGLSAAAQGTNDALERGLNNRQAFWNGLLNGAAEAIFEHASIGNFKKLKEVPSALGKDIFKNIGKSMLVNASEEALTEIANIAYDTIFNGELAHYSIEDLKNGAWKQALGQVVEAGASGALMGFGFGNMGNAIGYAKGAADAKARYGADPGKLVNEALEVNPKNGLAQRMQERLNDDKKVRGGQLLRLEQQTDRTALENDKAKIRQAAFDRLIELGAKEDVELVANALTKQAAGEELTKEEHDLIYKNKYAPRVAEELDPKKLLSGELREEDGYNTEWAEKLGTKRINVEEYSRLVEAAQIAPETVETTADTLPSVSENIAQEGTEAVETATISETETVAENATVTEEISTPELEEGKAILNLGGEVESVDFDSASPISSIKNGRMVLRLADGRTVSADSVTHASEDENLVYKTVQKLAPDTKNANIIVNGFKNSGMDAGSYARAVELVHMYGVKNLAMTDLLKSGSVPKLSAAVRNAAYKAGKVTGGREVAAAQARVEAVQGTAKTDGMPGRVLFTDGGKVTGTVRDYIKQSGRVLKPVQEAGLLAMEKLATALKMDLYVYESYRNKNGDLVYIDERGKEVKAPNGKYRDTNGHLYVDLNAGNSGSGTMLFTVAHELTHHIKQWSPAKYRVLANCVVKMINGRGGLTIDQLIAAQQKKAAENGRELTPDEAFDELIADSMETILADGKVIEMMAEIKKQDESLWKKVRDWFKNLAEELKSIVGEYEGRTPDSVEGLMVATLRKDLVNQLERLYAEALMDASENFNATFTAEESQTLTEAGIGFDEETESVYSLRYSTAYTDEIQVGRKTFDTEAIAQIVAKGTGRDIEDARKWVESEMAIANIVMTNPEFLDFDVDSRYEAIKKNSDYPQGTVDLSNLCPKREEFTSMFDMLQKKYPNKLFTAQDIADMRKILAKNDITVACGACFVEDRRQLIGEIADTFIGMWKEAVDTGKPLQKTNAAGNKSELLVTRALAKQYGLTPGSKIMAADTYIPNQYDLTTYEGFKLLEKNHPTIAMAFNRYNNSRGQQSARLIEGRAEYNRQILGWTDAKVRNVNNNGGLRIFSFSDFEVVHLLDLVQVIIDCSARGVKIQGYTKIPAFAKLVRDTGIKLNRSLIPKGDYGFHMENGKAVLDYDNVEGINIEDENFIDESDNPNVGNILIGINQTQISTAMLDPFVDYITPFHSNKAKAILKKLGTGEWVNYKESQHEKDIATGTASKHNVNIYTQVINKYHPTNKVEFVEAFLAECKRQGKIPRYAEFLNMDANGDYTYREGYHKLLVDFKMFDKDGNILPQGNITPNLDEGFMKDLLNAEVDKKKNYQFPQGVYEAIEQQFGEQADRDLEADVKYSIRSQFYNEFDAWDKKDTNINFVVGTTSNALLSIGMKNQNIVLRSGTVLQKINSHPEMTFDIFKGIPELLEHPVIVQFSDAVDPKTKKPKYNSSITVLGELYADVQEGGKTVKKPVLVSLELLPTNQKKTAVLNFSIIKSAYSKNALQQYLSENSILYIDPNKKRTDNWLSLNRLQLPLGENRYGSIRKITYANGIVKVQAPKNMTGMQKALFDAGVIDEYGNEKNSLRDSAGNELSTEQQAFFADSKVRDKNGNLLKVYHGTPKSFTTFRQGTAEGWGRGIYFTDNRAAAEEFGENIVEAYLNITNPFNADTMSYKDIDAESTNAYREFDMKQWKRWGRDNGYDTYEEYKEDGLGVDIEMVYDEYIDVFNQILRELGYDGIIATDSNGIDGMEIVAFNENQPKLTTNTAPTADPDIRYSDRDGESVSNRALLANAFEGAVTNDIEKAKLEEYKGAMDRMNAEEQKLQRLNAEIKELSFATGPRDTARIEKLRAEAQEAATNLETYDRILLRLEAEKPLQGVLEREKAKAYERAERKSDAALRKQREDFEEKSKQMQKELSDKYHKERKEAATKLRKIERENARLRDEVKDLKDLVKVQSTLTHGEKFKPSSVEKMANVLMKSYNAKGDAKELSGQLNEVYEYIAKGEELTWEGIEAYAMPAAEWLRDNMVSKNTDPYAEEITSELRGLRMKLSEGQKSEVAYRYGSYNDFRKQTVGYGVFTSKDDAYPLEDQWKELSEKYPDVFPPETHVLDMPSAYLDAIDTLNGFNRLAESQEREMLDLQGIASDIYDSYWRVSTLHTVADKKQAEIEKLRSRHRERMDAMKERHQEKLKELSAKYREKKQELVDKHHDQIAALKEKHTEQRENERDRRNKTAMRGKIRKVIGELDKLLNHGNKKTNVKAGMREFVAGAVSSAEVLFKDEHTDVDMVRDGIGVTLSEEEQLQYDKAREILSKMDKLTESNANALAEKTKLEGQLSYRLSKLKEALHRERIRINEAVVSDALGTLADEYEKLRDSEYAYVKGAFSESVYNYIKLLQRDIGGAKIKDMTLGQIEDLYKAYRMALTTVRDANKAFVASKSVDEIVENLVTEVERRKMPKTKAAAIARNLSNKIGWDYEKLYYALQRIGSNTLTELFTNLANAEDIVMADVAEADAKKMEIIKKYGYNNWNVDQKLNKVFMDTTGKRFQMTLGELMSLYAYSRRAGAWNHIEYGGFVFNKTALTDTDPVTTYKLNKEQCEAITNTLTDEQKHFVEEMQTFLSDTMGAKGNEVSMKLYGVEMFGEKNYFPVHVAGQFMVKAQESQAKAAAGFSSMTNAGFTQAQNKKAKAPFIMESFMEVWADHVNEMSRYHGTVPALEDIRKVMNYSSYSNAYAESVSVQAILENKYGKEAVQYFNDLYQEANSGAITDKLQKPAQKWISKFRKNSVAYSASVLIQQPASIVRAYAMLPMKYFRGKGVLTIPAGVGQAIFNHSAYKKAYGEMLKYAPGVTLSKEIGGFDTASGNSIRTYLLDTGKNIKQKWKTETDLKGRFNTVMDVVDDNPIANLPNVADKIAWIEIWNACKRETAAKNRDMETNSDAFMKLVGERFTEVIRATQVYDSMFSKSPLLKSKNMFVQSLVSFMNEPNTTANMVESAIRTAARGDRKTATRTITAVAGSVVFTCVLKSLVYAMRDEDEDKKYIEKYLGELTGNLISDFTVFNYIPYARDVWSLAQGFDVERSDMAIISDAMNSLKELATLAAKDTDEMTEDELTEFDKKVIKAHMSMLDSVCAAFGIPEKNIRREIKAILNTAGMLYKESGGKASWASIEDSVLEGVKGASPSFMGPKIQSKGDKLYEAIVSGDTAYADRLKGTYKDEDAVTSAIRKALGNNEPRILKAAELLVAQDYDEGLDLIDEIVDEGKFTWNDVVSAVNTKVNKLTEDESDEDTAEKTKSAVDAKAYINAILSGSSEDIAEVRESILYTKIENGKTEDEAKESLVSSAKEELKDRYIAEEISKPQVLSAMKTIGADKVEETVNKWTCEVATGISYEDQMAKYKAGNTSVSEYGRILTKYGGLSEEKAAEKIVEDSKAAYKDGTFDRNKMISILINYGGKDSAKAESTVQYMDYKLSHPDVSVDDAWIDKYNSEVKDSGINLDMYIEYKNQVKSIDGEGKKERRMAVIHSLPISNAQKDALYYSEGWTQSRIHEAPWH